MGLHSWEFGGKLHPYSCHPRIFGPFWEANRQGEIDPQARTGPQAVVDTPGLDKLSMLLDQLELDTVRSEPLKLWNSLNKAAFTVSRPMYVKKNKKKKLPQISANFHSLFPQLCS